MIEEYKYKYDILSELTFIKAERQIFGFPVYPWGPTEHTILPHAFDYFSRISRLSLGTDLTPYLTKTFNLVELEHLDLTYYYSKGPCFKAISQFPNLKTLKLMPYSEGSIEYVSPESEVIVLSNIQSLIISGYLYPLLPTIKRCR